MNHEIHAKELILLNDLKFFCDLLNLQKIPFLIWKGAALAYTHYQDPSLRPRVDSDIFILQSDKQKLFSTLKEHGYTLEPNQQDLLGQISFSKKINQLTVIYDIHWDLFAQQTLKSLFNFEELWSTRKRLSHVPGFTVSAPAALCLACLHWVAHHHSSEEAFWSTDIQLLSANHSTDWWSSFKKLCDDKKISFLIHKTLERAHVESPWRAAEWSDDEPYTYLLLPERSLWIDFKKDWSRLSMSERISMLYRHLFPQNSYMRYKYNVSEGGTVLPYYVIRILKGFTKIFIPR